jgi:hypothetical protein
VLFVHCHRYRTGVPTAVTLIGAPLRAGKQLSVIRWAPDGGHVIASDVAWGPKRLDGVRSGPGQLLSFAIDTSGKATIRDSIRVSLSPEGGDISRDGTMLVAVNMEGAYLLSGFPFVLFGRREYSSLSLVGFDLTSGALRMLDGPLAFDGVLPEDAVFDASGRMLAVAVFHPRVAQPTAGFIELFSIERSGQEARLVSTGVKLPTTRGPHDLVMIPAPAAPR